MNFFRLKKRRVRSSGAVAPGRVDKSRSDLSGLAEKGVPAPARAVASRESSSGPYGGPGPTGYAAPTSSRSETICKILAANVAACAFATGYQGNELVGMRLTEIVSVTDGFLIRPSIMATTPNWTP